jgi:hypothetical protein
LLQTIFQLRNAVKELVNKLVSLFESERRLLRLRIVFVHEPYHEAARGSLNRQKGIMGRSSHLGSQYHLAEQLLPVRLLDGFSGILQADGYSGYSQVCKESGLTRIGCWDHARRKFIEATQAAPSVAKGKSKPGASKADVALGYIGKLYAIEREQKERSDAERYQARQTRSMPLLAELKTWLENNVGKVMKGSLTRKAMEYTLGQWSYLVGYCERGDLHISNVLAENAIRPFAVGRKAWLFADSAQGAKASATCYSLLETAKANDLEPSAYINHVLAQIGEADTLEKLEALLPWNVPLEPIAKKVAQYNEGK